MANVRNKLSLSSIQEKLLAADFNEAKLEYKAAEREYKDVKNELVQANEKNFQKEIEELESSINRCVVISNDLSTYSSFKPYSKLPVAVRLASLFPPGPCLLPGSESKAEYKASPPHVGLTTTEALSKLMTNAGISIKEGRNFNDKIRDFYFNSIKNPQQYRKREQELRQCREWLNINVPLKDHQGNKIYSYDATTLKPQAELHWELFDLGKEKMCVGLFLTSLSGQNENIFGTELGLFTKKKSDSVLTPIFHRLQELEIGVCLDQGGYIFLTSEKFVKQKYEADLVDSTIKPEVYKTYFNYGDTLSVLALSRNTRKL